MITAGAPIPHDLDTVHQLIRELLATLGEQIHLNEKLQHQLEQLLRHCFGRKTERPRSRLRSALRLSQCWVPERHRTPGSPIEAAVHITHTPSPTKKEPAPPGIPRPKAGSKSRFAGRSRSIN